MAEYTEPSKNKARLLLINSAIEALTHKRHSSTLARRNYVRNVKNKILKSKDSDDEDKDEALKLSEKTIKNWENFYDSIVQTKRPENLKVAYLSGPNPENDLRVFVNHGILPENIWAFESNGKTYLKAVSSALASEFPFIKLLHIDIDAFFDTSPQRFDIIYLDFCGPMPSTNLKTLAVITKILAKHAINSPGVLVTNAALPSHKSPECRLSIAKLVAIYLYPKFSLENSENESGIEDGPICIPTEFTQWLKGVENNLDFYYGQYITRLIIDHVNFISPYDRFPNNTLFNRFFGITDENELNNSVDNFFNPTSVEHSSVEESFKADNVDDSSWDFDDIFEEWDTLDDPIFDGEDDINKDWDECDISRYPILWSFLALHNKDNICSRFIVDEKFKKLSKAFLNELNIKKDDNNHKFINNIQKLTYLLREGNGKYLSETLKTIKKKHLYDKYYRFCDLVLFHQIVELLFRQVAYPYHVNIEKVKRWTYKSKENKMFLDMFILDECRYVYDWMPTMDMIANGFANEERQLAYRFALDAIAKHNYYYSSEILRDTAVIDRTQKGFEAKTLSIRELIEEQKT